MKLLQLYRKGSSFTRNSVCRQLAYQPDRKVDGQSFMTPADFLEAVTEAAPRKSAYKKSYSREEIIKRLNEHTHTIGEKHIEGIYPMGIYSEAFLVRKVV